MAQSTLSQLKERIAGEDAAGALNWFRVDSILESANISTYTKYYSMQVRLPVRDELVASARDHHPIRVVLLAQILDEAIKFRWKSLPAEQAHVQARTLVARADSRLHSAQCAGIKAFVVNLVIQRSSNEEVDATRFLAPSAGPTPPPPLTLIERDSRLTKTVHTPHLEP